MLCLGESWFSYDLKFYFPLLCYWFYLSDAIITDSVCNWLLHTHIGIHRIMHMLVFTSHLSMQPIFEAGKKQQHEWEINRELFFIMWAFSFLQHSTLWACFFLIAFIIYNYALCFIAFLSYLNIWSSLSNSNQISIKSIRYSWPKKSSL